MNEEIRLKIEAYLGGNLSLEETLEFERKLENSAELREELLLSREINNHFREDFDNIEIPNNDHVENLKAFLKSDEAEEIKTKLSSARQQQHLSNNKPNRKNYLYAAAAVVAILVATIGFVYFNQNSPQKLYAQYYSESDLPSVIKRNDQESNLELGAAAFQEEQYENAIKLFQTYIKETHEIDPSVYLYIGASYVELQKPNEAIIEFDRMINSNSIDHSKGLWFKALAYLYSGDKQNAKITLEELVKDSSNFNFNKSLEILQKL